MIEEKMCYLFLERIFFSDGICDMMIKISNLENKGVMYGK